MGDGVKSKKEVAGVDFVYGLEVVCSPAPVVCLGCCFRSSGGCFLRGSCLLSRHHVYELVKIPRKKAYVVGLAKIGAWLEENGYEIKDDTGNLYSETAKNRCVYTIGLLHSAGKPISATTTLGSIPEELIEYK